MGVTPVSDLPSRSIISPALKMKSMFLVAALLAVAAAYPLELEEVEASTEIYREPILIVKSSSVNDPEKGIYSYSFEGANGIILSADGQQKQIGEKEEEAGVVSKGSYSYQMDGVTYTVDWVADENGFRQRRASAHPTTHARARRPPLGRPEARRGSQGR